MPRITITAHIGADKGCSPKVLACFGIVLLLILAMPAVMLGDTYNVVQDSSFEDVASSPWMVGESYCGFFGDGPCLSWQQTSQTSHTGDYSLVDVGDTEVFQYFQETPAALDSVSFWLLEDPAVLFAYEFLYSDGSTGSFLIFPVDNTWQFYDVTANLDPSKFLVGIGFWNYSAFTGENGPAFLDDVTVNTIGSYSEDYIEFSLYSEMPEPSSCVLLTFALLPLLAKVRKARRNR